MTKGHDEVIEKNPPEKTSGGFAMIVRSRKASRLHRRLHGFRNASWNQT
jgi:hypothetical protein